MSTEQPSSSQAQPAVKVIVTETVTRTYYLTSAVLDECDLPHAPEELEAMYPDEVYIDALDALKEDEYAVTDRTVEAGSVMIRPETQEGRA